MQFVTAEENEDVTADPEAEVSLALYPPPTESLHLATAQRQVIHITIFSISLEQYSGLCVMLCRLCTILCDLELFKGDSDCESAVNMDIFCTRYKRLEVAYQSDTRHTSYANFPSWLLAV